MTRAPTIGVLMLDTRFPRPVGDIGNPASFPGPVIYRVVEGASAGEAVRGDPSGRLAAFIAAGHELVGEGAEIITTSCGFLSLFQDELEAALNVPVVASSLSQVSAVEAGLEGKRAGIITIDAEALSSTHLRAAGVREDIAIAGLPSDGALATMIFGDLPELDAATAEAEMIAAGMQLSAQVPDLGALVLECTNMGPYKAALVRAVAVPVYTILDAIEARAARGGDHG